MNSVKLFPSLALVAVAGLGLSGCGGANESAPAAPTSPSVESIAPSATSSPSEPARSPRGNIIKTFGQPGGQFHPETKEQTVNFVISSITVDAPCTTAHALPAENGHYVILDASIETLPALAQSSIDRFDLSPHSFQLVGANGTTYNGSLATGASYGCLPDEELLPINGVGPAEKVTGKIVLDVPETTGTLVFKPMGGYSGGWEWAF